MNKVHQHRMEDYWEALTSLSDGLNVAEGYALYMSNTNGGMIIDYTGPIGEGVKSIDLTRTTSAGGSNYSSSTSPEGWVLVSNPYCSPITITDLVNGGPASMLKSFYRWTHTNGSYVSYNTTLNVVHSLGLPDMCYLAKHFVPKV